jgi:hypothetical protein
VNDGILSADLIGTSVGQTNSNITTISRPKKPYGTLCGLRIVELQFTSFTVHISIGFCPYKDKRIKFLSLVFYGEMVEWFKALVLKTSDVNSVRGFESHSLLLP